MAPALVGICSNVTLFNLPLLSPFPFQVQTYLKSALECITQIAGHLEPPGTSPTQSPFTAATGCHSNSSALD